MGKGGARVHDLSSDEIFAHVISSNPEYIFIQIGGNDIVSPSSVPIVQQVKGIAQGIRELVDRFIDWGIKHIFVGEVFYREKPRGISLLDYKKIRSKVNRALYRNLDRVDRASFIHFPSIGHARYLVDGTHLDYQGYQIYVKVIIDRLKLVIEG